MRNRTRLITLGTEGEFEMYGLTLRCAGDVDPTTPVCLPVERALGLLLPILETLWKLDRATQARLLKVSPSTLELYRRGRSVPRRRAQLERIADLTRIYAALRVLLPRPEAADAWPTKSNARFRPNPVAYMKRHGIKGVERYLGAELAG